MLSFEQAQAVLTKIADILPLKIYNELNGGIILLPEHKLHPQSINDDLFILGEYHYDPQGFGRYITLYYGSFARVYGCLSDELLTKRLREVLHHELIHHLEGLAGDASLEAVDARDLARYRSQNDKVVRGGRQYPVVISQK